MANKPTDFQWLGFTAEQRGHLDFLDHLGNNGWARNGQTDELMPKVLADCADDGLTLERIQEAMQSIGYSPQALHMLSRWEAKRTTGRFGR